MNLDKITFNLINFIVMIMGFYILCQEAYKQYKNNHWFYFYFSLFIIFGIIYYFVCNVVEKIKNEKN